MTTCTIFNSTVEPLIQTEQDIHAMEPEGSGEFGTQSGPLDPPDRPPPPPA